MPTKPARPCRYPRCPGLSADVSGYCPAHVHLYKPFTRSDTQRPSASSRGYNRSWQSIRARVLAEHNIPKVDWPRYDVDHNPPYDSKVEPDHTKYTLIPRLHADHSRKTIRESIRGRQFNSLHTQNVDRSWSPDVSDLELSARGF